jgi:hypothetical protein
MTLTGKSKISGQNHIPGHFSSTNLILTDLESSSGHCCGRPASNNCLSHGTATKTKINVNFIPLRISYLKENTLHRHVNNQLVNGVEESHNGLLWKL